MLATHEEQELRSRFGRLMEYDLDLYNMPEGSFSRAYLAFMALDIENESLEMNLKVRRIRVEGRSFQLVVE